MVSVIVRMAQYVPNEDFAGIKVNCRNQAEFVSAYVKHEKFSHLVNAAKA
jgi:hypothetical protein